MFKKTALTLNEISVKAYGITNLLKYHFYVTVCDNSLTQSGVEISKNDRKILSIKI